MNEGSISLDEPPPGAFRTRIEALQVRVNKAALALHERNVRPTVQRIRTALGGGSPNDLAPALKKWRDEVLPALKTADDTPVGVPPLIADIVRELWTRALAAAAVEAVGGAKARRAIAQTEEVATLRGEIDRLRDQLEREQQVVGQLREARARAEAIMSDALTRIEDAERRERRLNAQIGLMRERTPMVASVRQAAPVTRRPRTSKRPKRAHRPASRKKGKSPKLPKKLPAAAKASRRHSSDGRRKRQR